MIMRVKKVTKLPPGTMNTTASSTIITVIIISISGSIFQLFRSVKYYTCYPVIQKYIQSMSLFESNNTPHLAEG